MNPWDLSASDLLVWGIVLHLIADWPLQNDWMANNKMRRRVRKMHIPPGEPGVINYTKWWDRHPAAYVHAGIHGILLSLVFGWVAIPLAIAHLIVDCRWIVEKWSKLVRQSQPQGRYVEVGKVGIHQALLPAWDIGTEVRFWVDQVFHIFCVAVAALLV